MAKVISTTKGETVHTVELTQSEVDIILAFLGQGRYNGEPAKLHNTLLPLRVGRVRLQGNSGRDSIPVIDIVD